MLFRSQAVFIGDEAKIGQDLTINAGFRYDRLNLDMEGYNNATFTVYRDTSHADYSASLGLNYLIGKRSAVYANATRAYRMPDYSAYSVLGVTYNATTFAPTYRNAPNGISKNEIIQNAEIGYRTGFGDLGIDFAGYYTNIANRLAVFYENGVGISKPQGTNSIRGLELGLTYAPSQVRGLLLRGNMTYQKAQFEDYNLPIGASKVAGKWTYNVDPNGNLYGNTIEKKADSTATSSAIYFINLKGKQLPGVPALLANLIGSYDSKFFGVNVNYNLVSQVYYDATNIVKAPDVHTVNAGMFGRYFLKNGNEIRLDFLVKNLINSDNAFRILYLNENDTALRQKQKDATLAAATSGWVSGIPQLPRRFLVTLSYKF